MMKILAVLIGAHLLAIIIASGPGKAAEPDPAPAGPAGTAKRFTLPGTDDKTLARLALLRVTLRALGKEAEITPIRLDYIVKYLSGTGSPTDEAEAAVLAFARAPEIDLGERAASSTEFSAPFTLLLLARDIGLVRGQNMVSVVARMTAAFGKGAEAALAYAYY